MITTNAFLILFIGIIVMIMESVRCYKDPNLFKIGAFNVQIFGPKKASNQEVMKILSQIVRKYDIILIQEIRDKSGEASQKLLAAVNTKKYKYSMLESNRLGRTHSKETYAFYYRNDIGITVLDSFHYDDGSEKNGTDSFEREPFVVKFLIPSLSVSEIGFIGLHVDPDTVIRELTALTDVFKVARKKFKINDIIALGDMNSGCNYLSKKQENLLPLKSDEYFWPIPYGKDTTLASKDCSYDRFIVGGKDLIDLVKTGRTAVYRFDKEHGLDLGEAMSVSDHYPIEIILPVKPSVTTTESSFSINTMNWKLTCSILVGAMLFMMLLELLL